MKTYLLGALLLCSGATLINLEPVVAQNLAATSYSEVADVALPSNTFRFAPKAIPHEITDALQTAMKASGENVRPGNTEVLGWSGHGYRKSHAGEFKARVAAALTKAGWNYEEGEKLEGAQDATLVTASKTEPNRKGLVGFWVPTDDALILAWTEMLPLGGTNGNTGIVPPVQENAPENSTGAPTKEIPPVEAKPSVPVPATGTIIELSDDQFVVNAAKGLPTPKVSFAPVTLKPGKACGYVKGTDGKPLRGAVIGVRSTAVGGAETSVEGKTDANGYYELLVPFGAAGFYAAGYNKEYGDGILALGLTPADGEADEFASNKGHVENWIMMPYGIADRGGVQDNPKYLNNYFGGSVTFEFLDEYNGMAGDKGLPFGSTVELTFTPNGSLLDGSKGRTITIRKAIKENVQKMVWINNIPIGMYHLSARMLFNGASKTLHLREFGPDRGSAFGLDPKEAQGSVDVSFRPWSARAASASAGHGNWKEVNVDVMQ